MRRFALAALAALALAAPCRAQYPPAPDNTEWTTIEESTSPSAPGTPSTGTAPGDISWGEQVKFLDNLYRNLFDQVCRNIDVNASQNLAIDGAGSVGVGIRRRLAILPNRHIAIVDEKKLSLSPGHTFPLGAAGQSSYGFWAGGQVQGTSYVVRETPAVNSCDEVLQLLNLPSYFKQTVVFPIRAEALSKMAVGEMWKVPMVFNLGASINGSLPLVPAPAPGGISVSLGRGENGSSMMTVYRYVEGGEQKIRFRLRVDHARVYNAGGAFVAGYQIGELFSLGSGIIHQGFSQLDRLAEGTIDSFLTASIGYYGQKSEGQELVVEFDLDPNDPKQMEKLAKSMNGDFWTLAKLAGAMLLHIDGPAESIFEYIELVKKNKATMGRPPSLAVTDAYRRKNHSFPINFPLLVHYSWSSSRNTDHIEFKDLADPVELKDAVGAADAAPGGRFDLAQAENNSSTSYLNLPNPIGSAIKRASARSVQAFFHTDKDGKESDPQAVYIRQEGFVRRSGGKAREMAENVNRIMTLMGARGGAANPKYAIPLDLDRIHAEKSPQPAPGTPPRREPPATLHDGAVALTIVFTEKAVRQVLGSAADLIVRCYVNTLEGLERRVMDWILDHGKMDSKGLLSYDEDALFAKFDLSKDHNWPKFLCQAAAGIVADIAAAREAPDKRGRLAALIDLMAGGGKSGLAYDDIMRVLVQLVDPMDITADLVLNVTKGKGLDNIRTHIAVSKGRAPNPLAQAVAKAKKLILQPSVVVD